MSDYGLLEEVDRTVDAGTRLMGDIAGGNAPRRPRNASERLRRESLKKRIRLLFMPAGLSRGKRNTSVVRDHCTIFWRVEITLGEWLRDDVNGSSEPRYIAQDRVSEKETILSIILKALTELKKHGEARAYGSENPSQLFVGLFAEKEPAEAYWPLKLEETLLESLQKRTIIEFPRIVIAFPGEAGRFPPPKATTFETGKGEGTSPADSANMNGADVIERGGMDARLIQGSSGVVSSEQQKQHCDSESMSISQSIVRDSADQSEENPLSNLYPTAETVVRPEAERRGAAGTDEKSAFAGEACTKICVNVLENMSVKIAVDPTSRSLTRTESDVAVHTNVEAETNMSENHPPGT